MAHAELDLEEARLEFIPMDRTAARAIASWRYPPPYDIYDLSPAAIPALIEPQSRYFAVYVQGELMGLCCFGFEAQVPGGEYGLGEPAFLDVGLGMRPDLVGQGRGARFAAAVICFGMDRYSPRHLRATIAAFNRRSQRTFERLGFVPVHFFVRRCGDMSFIQMERPAEGFATAWGRGS